MKKRKIHMLDDKPYYSGELSGLKIDLYKSLCGRKEIPLHGVDLMCTEKVEEITCKQCIAVIENI
jgi:hypothetical protein